MLLNENRIENIFNYWDIEKKGYLNKKEFKFAYVSVLGFKYKNKIFLEKIKINDFKEFFKSSKDYNLKELEKLIFENNFDLNDLIKIKEENELNLINEAHLKELYLKYK